MRVLLVGFGVVARSFAEVVLSEGPKLAKEYGLKPKVVGIVDSHGDHRIAMSFAMAALVASGPITITDCANVNTSFPGFVALANKAGLGLTADPA